MWDKFGTIRAIMLSPVIALSACTAVDSFEPRAIQYNQEAAHTKSNTILLNILRSAYRLPLQFTEFTTTTGQTFAQAQIAATLPVSTVPSNLAKTFSLTPQLQATAQDQVTVQNLNSQEFYYGLQTPLTQQMLATFMSVGYDPEVVLMLAVSSLRRTSKVIVNQIENDPTDFRKLSQFYSALKLLLAAGLTFENAKGEARGIGPELNEDQARQFLPQYIKASATAAANGSANSLPELTQQGNKYQLTQSKSSFRICFRKDKLDTIAQINKQVLVAHDKENYIVHLVLMPAAAEPVPAAPVPLFDMTILPSHLCGAKPDPKASVNWNFELRSTQGIYSYLGKFVQVELADPQNFEYYYQLPRDFGGKPFFLFKVYGGFAPEAVVTANLGSTFSVLPATPYDQDKSSQVVSLLTDLWALESSAKSFPAVSTVSVTAQ